MHVLHVMEVPQDLISILCNFQNRLATLYVTDFDETCHEALLCQIKQEKNV